MDKVVCIEDKGKAWYGVKQEIGRIGSEDERTGREIGKTFQARAKVLQSQHQYKGKNHGQKKAAAQVGRSKAPPQSKGEDNKNKDAKTVYRHKP